MKSVGAIVFAVTFLCFRSTRIEGFDDQKELNYGDKCGSYHGRDTNHQVCNRTSKLICGTETSKCDCDLNHIYNKDLGMCVGDFYGRCTPSSDNSCNAGLTCLDAASPVTEGIPPSLVETITKLQQLHPQSERPLSEPYYMCWCPTGYGYFGEDQNKTECLPFLNLGDACPKNSTPSNSSCNYQKELICGPAGTCACDKPSSYNEELQRCEKPLGANCTDYERCGKHAICSKHLAHIVYELLSSNLISKTSFDRQKLNLKAECMCAPGFKANAVGECVGGYQVPCDKDSDCDSNLSLSCVNGACDCKMPSGMTYFQAEAECKIDVGYPCTQTAGPSCVKNAVCKKNQCVCEDGFTEAGDGRCLLGQGSKCSMSYRVNSTVSACNHFQGLACKESKCECFDSMFKWNSKTNMCVAKTGKRCGEIQITRPPIPARDVLYPIKTSGVTHFYVGCEVGSICVSGAVRKYCQKVK